jgi:hypothetical protein
MRLGTAARLWDNLQPAVDKYCKLLSMLDRKKRVLEREMELCYIPFSIEDGLRGGLENPPATMLVLPNGRVKVAAALPYICADLRGKTQAEAWQA